MEIKTTNKEWVKKMIIRDKGSLDYPCDFCNKNSYNNIHIFIDKKLVCVVCDNCLKEVDQ